MSNGCTQIVLAGFLVTIIAGPALAQSDPFTSPLPSRQPPGQIPAGNSEQLVRVEAVCDTAKITPGATFHLAFIFKIEPHWHIYWKNAGASGGPTEIQISVPPGYTVGETQFPRPLILDSEEGATYGYENQVVLYVPVTAPPELVTNQAVLNAKINWMVCKDICLLGHTAKMITVSAGQRGLPTDSPLSSEPNPAVKEFKARLPQPLNKLDGASAKMTGDTLLIDLPAGSYATAQFFPIEMPGVTYGKATVKKETDLIHIMVPVTVDANNAMGQQMKVIGVVGLGQSQSDPCYEFEIPLTAQ